MNKPYNLIYIINILLGLALSFSFLFIIRYDMINILYFVLICLFYIVSFYIYHKNKKDVTKTDMFVLYLYLFFTMFLFVFNVLYQTKYVAYSFMYNNIFVYTNHLLFIIYNYAR